MYEYHGCYSLVHRNKLRYFYIFSPGLGGLMARRFQLPILLGFLGDVGRSHEVLLAAWSGSYPLVHHVVDLPAAHQLQERIGQWQVYKPVILEHLKKQSLLSTNLKKRLNSMSPWMWVAMLFIRTSWQLKPFSRWKKKSYKQADR